MWRRTFLPFAAIAALAVSTGAAAQQAPVAAPAEATAHRAYSPAEMRAFARATAELQRLGSQDPAAMTRVIEGAGMNVGDYNQMGDAMRADPALAESLNPYLDATDATRVPVRAQRAAPQRSVSTRKVVAAHRSAVVRRSRGGHHAQARVRAARHVRGGAHASHSGRKAASHAKIGRRARHTASSRHVTGHRRRRG